MRINKLTITGADNNTDFKDILKSSNQYAFIEWGILLSRDRVGENRFPSRPWLKMLIQFKKDYPYIKFAAHLCGSLAREFDLSEFKVYEDEKELYDCFDRFQLNITKFHEKYDPISLIKIFDKYPLKEFIFQTNSFEAEEFIIHMRQLSIYKNVSLIFDTSGGKGIERKHWRAPIKDIEQTYAGGLGPNNIKEQLELILEAYKMEYERTEVGSPPNMSKTIINLDMESNVRTYEILDFEKVNKVAEEVKRFNERENPSQSLCNYVNEKIMERQVLYDAGISPIESIEEFFDEN